MSTVAIAIPYIDRWYFASLLEGATAAFEAAGHSVVTRAHVPTPSARMEIAALVQHDLEQQDVVGALIAGFHYDEAQASAALALGKPLVAVGGAQPGFPTVMIDDIGAARTATEHLVKLGHRRVTHLAGKADGQMDFAVHSRRRKGYAVAMASAGLAPDLVEVPFDPHAAYTAVAELLTRSDRPTGIFAVSDEMALPAMQAIADAGLQVGVDVSVVGFDDHPLAEGAGLTTMRQDPRALGDMAAKLLLARLEAGSDGDHGSRLMYTPLVERTSARRPSLQRTT